MSDAKGLRALIERVERAEGPDRELDAEIACAVLPHFRGKYPNIFAPGSITYPGGFLWNACHYTSSLDAAASLVPEGWQWTASGGCRQYQASSYCTQSHVSGRPTTEGDAATPALALTAAALRARLAGMEASHDR
jgi:hypothetical protein